MLQLISVTLWMNFRNVSLAGKLHNSDLVAAMACWSTHWSGPEVPYGRPLHLTLQSQQKGLFLFHVCMHFASADLLTLVAVLSKSQSWYFSSLLLPRVVIVPGTRWTGRVSTPTSCRDFRYCTHNGDAVLHAHLPGAQQQQGECQNSQSHILSHDNQLFGLKLCNRSRSAWTMWRPPTTSSSFRATWRCWRPVKVGLSSSVSSLWYNYGSTGHVKRLHFNSCIVFGHVLTTMIMHCSIVL